MAAAVAFRQPLLPATLPTMPAPASSSQRSNDSRSTDSRPSPSTSHKGSKGRKERPCDACRRKKSRCVMSEGQPNSCVACNTHGHQCTFLEDPRPRKRRLDSDGKDPNLGKRRSVLDMQTPSNPQGAMKIKREESGGSTASRSDGSSNSWQYQGSHMGYTTELDPILFDVSHSGEWSYQKPDGRNAFLIPQPGTPRYTEPQTNLIQTIERHVGSHGPSLMQHFRSINRSLPIIEGTLFETYNNRQRGSLDPALLCSIYLVAAASGLHELENARWQQIDLVQLEGLAFRLFENALLSPTLSTIQAGLLLMQMSNIDSKFLNTQLVGAAFELGLHLDCSNWTISPLEQGLRKRLAWAMYMEDQWCSLVHGRPSLISKAHWAVHDLCGEDFETTDRLDENISFEDLKLGRECFCQMVVLTGILSSILEALYTQKAMQEFDDAKESGTRLVLARAKPIQVTLKEWFTRLPKDLKMDNGQAPATIGHLHLAYFATEITLHRCIIRSLSSTPTDTYLTHVCRSAAKARLISAMEFVNRLRPIHLTSFWYFPSRVNFALIATFGSLLLATAPCQEEADFYKARLAEYRWALSVSARSAGFLNFAIESLESSTGLLKDMPKKPKLDEMDVREMPAPPPPSMPRTILIPPPEEEDEDDAMDDGTDTQSVPIPVPDNFSQRSELLSPSASAWSAPARYTGHVHEASFGPYIGPFAGLGTRDWFDTTHHGSPETERTSSFCGIALGLATIVSLFTQINATGHSDYCLDLPLSCSNATAQNTCCFNYPGGDLLQTQFWDTDPATGPANRWTIHGLWPDHCDGTYSQYCDESRQYTNISAILTSYGATSLLSYMEKYWKDNGGNDEAFWEHEWGKHGTCISTLDPNCYVNYTPQEEVVDYFQKTVDLFRTLNSYVFLKIAGIVPSTTTTYTSAQIQKALGAFRGGVNASIQCGGKGKDELQQIYYHFHVAGSAQDGIYVPIQPVGTSSCPQTGVKYLPKNGSSTPKPVPGKLMARLM